MTGTDLTSPPTKDRGILSREVDVLFQWTCFDHSLTSEALAPVAEADRSLTCPPQTLEAEASPVSPTVQVLKTVSPLVIGVTV